MNLYIVARCTVPSAAWLMILVRTERCLAHGPQALLLRMRAVLFDALPGRDEGFLWCSTVQGRAGQDRQGSAARKVRFINMVSRGVGERGERKREQEGGYGNPLFTGLETGSR